MTIEFQENLLKFLFQDKGSKKFYNYLEPDLFKDEPMWKELFKMWQNYVKKYKHTPSRNNFKEYFEQVIKKQTTPVSQAIYDDLANAIELFYSPLDGDNNFITEQIIEFAQRKLTRELFKSGASKIKDADDKDFEAWNKEMTRIVRLRDQDNDFEKNKGGNIFGDHEVPLTVDEYPTIPFFLDQINAMTSRGGFRCPQNIVFVGGAKRFKTGLLLNAGIDLALTGYKVFYADKENGNNAIKERARQVVLDCNARHIKKYGAEFSKIAKQVLARKGEFKHHFFPAGATLDDLEYALERYHEEEGFKPDVIIHDYAHKWKSADKSIRDKRLVIQDTYDRIPAINYKWGAFSITVSPASAGAADHWVMTEADYGEDKGIAYNCHAAFAICRVSEEMKQGTAHIIPINQREGTGYKHNAETTCAIKIDEENMQIEEIDPHAYLVAMKDYVTERHVTNNKAGKKKEFLTSKEISGK